MDKKILKFFGIPIFLVLLMSFASAVIIVNDTWNQDLVGYWNFDEDTGTSLYDFSDFGNNGTLASDVDTMTNYPKWVDGIIGSALEFNVTNQSYVNIPNSTAGFVNLGVSKEFTISVWANLTGRDNQIQTFFSKAVANERPAYRILHDNDDTVYASVGYTSELNAGVSSGVGANGFVWTHYIFTGNSTDILLYINNSLMAFDTMASNPVNTTSENMSIGKGYYSGSMRYLDGVIDELAIWNRTLNSSEITQLYNSGAGYSLLIDSTNISINGVTYNNVAYEYKNETFIINVSYNDDFYTTVSADLIYNGTLYDTTQSSFTNGSVYTTTLDIPQQSGADATRSFYWNFTGYNGTDYFFETSDIYNQTVGNTTLSICGAEGGNVAFINYTFKDEQSGDYINASLDLSTWTYYLGSGDSYNTLIYTNTTENFDYGFCFVPPDETLYYEVDFQYSGTDYPQRYYSSSGTLTNGTTNTTLYLLGSSDGIYSSFQIVTGEGSPISGATVLVERQFSGVWTTVGQGTSDSSGLTTFWLNNNYDHRVTVSKDGYVTTTITIRPTQSVYTIIMSSTSGNYEYNSSLDGIYFTRSPTPGFLVPGTYDFVFNVTAANENLVNCKLELVNSTDDVLDSDSTACTDSAYISISYTIAEGEDLYGKYYVDVGDGYVALEIDGNWKGLAANVTRKYTFKDFFTYLADSGNFAEDSAEQIKYEYTKMIAFFLILALIIGYANYKTGFESSQGGILFIGLPILMIFVSIASSTSDGGHGFFYMANATRWDFFNNHILAVYSFLLGLGMYFATIRREG